MRKFKISKIKTGLLIILIICAFLICDFYGVKILRVITSSMEPGIKKGSVIIIMESRDFRIGDIASYKTLQNKNTITHRIVKISKSGDRYYFNFKGDSNENPDPYIVSESEIVGKYFFSIPFLGDVVSLLSNSKLLFLLLGLWSGFISGKLLRNNFFD